MRDKHGDNNFFPAMFSLLFVLAGVLKCVRKWDGRKNRRDRMRMKARMRMRMREIERVRKWRSEVTDLRESNQIDSLICFDL